MSIEAFGDEGNAAPEGYVSEDTHLDLEKAHNEALQLLGAAYAVLEMDHIEFLAHASDRSALAKQVDAWLDGNVPKMTDAENWRIGLLRLLQEGDSA